MRKSLLMVGLFFVMGTMFVMSPAVMAQTETEQQEAMSEVEEITGKIVSLNAERNSIRLEYSEEYEEGKEAETKSISIYLNESTDITNESNEIEFSDLKTGDQVVITFTKDDDWKKVAKTVTVKSAMAQEE